MITVSDLQFLLNTDHTSYAFHVLPSGHPEHQYYGAKIDLRAGAEALNQKVGMLGGNGIAYSKEYPLVCLEDICLECSGTGHGDIRDPFVEITWEDGSRSTDFRYREHWVSSGKTAPRSLPASYGLPEAAEELHLLLEDASRGAELELIYAVFAACDVITRRSVLRMKAGGKETAMAGRLMSLQLDLDDADYVFHTFTGAWAREMNHQQIPLRQGKWVSESRCGVSSSMNNPFVMLSRPETTETAGDCFGFNLVYSGNHYEAAEVSAYGKTRILTGMHPEGFEWRLRPGEELESPEAVMAFSAEGFTGLSRAMHAFVREHIIRGEWKYRERPVLLNSWEAVYFDFNEEKILAMAAQAKAAGIELFVLDDGWFGVRNDDTSSLGDWFVNRDKLPDGIGGLAEKIEAMGMKFGLWVEPEMVSVNSELYRSHPDWAVEGPRGEHSEGRHQRILDLTRTEVQDWLIGAMSDVFGQPGVSYVKWDNNRIFTDFYSRGLERQGEFLHRYYMGCYRVFSALTARFPHILFEGCASGGNRFDLGILCFMPQIWVSDNTDALCRTLIQTGLSYGYPMSVAGAHVSAAPNHQTGRVTPLGTRFGVAAFGVLGYELNLSSLSEEELEQVKKQITFYKEHRRTLQYGEYYRLAVRRRSDFESGVHQWMAVSGDGTEALGFAMGEQVIPNITFSRFTARGLKEKSCYRFRDWNAAEGLGTEEDVTASGSLLNRAGVKLAQSWPGYTGRPGMRQIRDMDCRIFVMEETETPGERG